MRSVLCLIVVAMFVALPLSAEAAKRVSSNPSTATGSKSSSTNVKGHVTKKGSYVAPHKRSTPDKSKANNWSAKGNTNPYTGKRGTK
jgi:hypothetical protein